MNNGDNIDLSLLWKHARRLEFKDGVFIVDPNNWSDVQSWFENKSEYWDLIVYFGLEYIEKLAQDKGLNLIEAVEYVWKEKYEYDR